MFGSPFHLGPMLAALLVIPSACLAQAVAPAYDGKGNRYVVAIDDDARIAHVEADVWMPSQSLAMFGVQATSALPNGQADLVRGLVASDGKGQSLAITDLGEGDFELSGQGRVHLRYDVALEHDRHAWPAGVEEVSYHTSEGLMATGYALLLAPGDGMEGDIDVRFKLPKGWTANTPWQTTGDNRFTVSNRRELLNNALFLGTAESETLAVGGVSLTLVLGKRYRDSKPLFVELLGKQMLAYGELFGGEPLSQRYLVIVNEGVDDGGAFASSFSQMIGGDADAGNRLGWGYVMSHELLHFWNGLSLVPSDPREEWFKEGITDYLTVVTQSRNGLLDEPKLFWRLENTARRYLFARVGQRLGMTVRDAGADKQANRELVYGGGALAGFALDIELRKASDGRIGLPDLMRLLYAESGKPGKTYSLPDLQRHAQALIGKDFTGFFAGVVESKDFFDARPYFEEVGLLLNNYLYDESFVRRNPNATDAQKARFDEIFVRAGD